MQSRIGCGERKMLINNNANAEIETERPLDIAGCCYYYYYYDRFI